MEVSRFFHEASDLIIQMCIEADLPLNLSERKRLLEIERMKEAWAQKPLEVAGRRFDFSLAEDSWRQAGYADQEMITLTPASKDLAALRKNRPVIDQFIGLGENVFFELDGQWYEFHKKNLFGNI